MIILKMVFLYLRLIYINGVVNISNFLFWCLTLFLTNQVSKLSNFFSIFVSRFYFCSRTCLNFFIFSILVSQIYFNPIKGLNFYFFFNQVLLNQPKLFFL